MGKDDDGEELAKYAVDAGEGEGRTGPGDWQVRTTASYKDSKM
jgi:hypothetical protein